jgi:hypothetical protein
MPQPTVTINYLTSYWRTVPAHDPDNLLDSHGGPSYFDLQLSGYVTGALWLDAWCLNPNINIDGNLSTYTATVYSSYELNLLPSGIVVNPANLGRVNWVINQTNDPLFNSQFNYGEIQSAIWNLMGYPIYVNGVDITADGTVLKTDVEALVALASSHGSFIPENYQYIGVILDPVAADGVTHLQPIITLVHPASLGDYVWNDRNANGIQDDGETGINGATVNLWRDLNGNGVRDGANELLATTTTHTNGNDGYYEFKGLTPGLEYQVEFVQPTGLIGVSAANQGSSTALDSNGVKQSGQINSEKIYLNPGDFNQTIDQGFYNSFDNLVPKASLGDYVWIDSNVNGLQDADEIGVAGVTVVLTGGGADGTINGIGDTTTTTTTAANGFYEFTDLAPGVEYQVQFIKPTGSVFTTTDVGINDDIDSDANVVDGKTQIVSLAPGERNPSLDAGIYSAAIDIEKYVMGRWETEAGGGEGLTPGFWKTHSEFGPAPLAGWPESGYSPNDSYEAIFGVDVSGTPTLLDALGTNGGGVNALLRHSSAALLNAANPYVDYAYTVTEIIAQTKAAIESGNATLIESTKNQFAVQNELGADLSTPETGSIHETAWYDADLPGSGPVIPVGGEAIFQYVVTNEGDVAIDNVSVTDSRLATVTYVSGDLDNDNKLDTNETWVYTASETVQGGTDVVNTGTVTGTGGSIPVSDEDDAHYSTPGLAQSLGDRVWLDANANGIQDAGEQGLAGVTVLLKDTVGAVLQTTTTDFNGNYLFDVAVGSYQVTFETPSDYVVSPSDKGSDDNLDSDIINPATKTTGTIAIAAGEQNLSVDAGVYQTASLGDKVWLDCNGNGVQDGGEVGVAGATVKLIGGGADGKIATTSDNTITTTTTSAASGHVGEYAFTGLTPGMEYQVQFVPLTGYSFTTKDAAAATDATDSDADLVTGKTQVVKLASGENNPTLDAGLTPDCRPVTFDFSGSSATDGTDGNSRTYTDALTGVSVTARAFSQSKLADNTPTNTWQTAWLGAYSGGLGVTDSSEGTGSGNTHTVDNVGRNNYVVLQFSQSVKLDQAYLGYVVNDSDMKVWIGNSASTITTMDNSVLSSMSFSEVNTTTLSSARWADLNAGGVTGNVVIIAADTTDTSPEDYFKVEKVAVCAPDYCLPVAKASIGDFVWEDKNYNGVQDGGESGIANVTVKLLNSANTVLATTTTDSSGKYLFSNLTPGDYKVQVVAPSGYGVTKQDQGSDNAKDSDINSSGITALTTLSADEDDLRWDAGLYRKASVGDKVWEDWNHNNVQDVGEGGIGNIKVQLLNATGTSVLATTYTDSSGNYLFSNLNPGTYMLQFDKTNVSFSNSHWGGTYNMSDWKWAVKDAKISGVNNDAKDSDVAGDAISKTNVSKTDAFTLVAGQNDLTRDAGITPIVIDLDGNGIQTISRANSGGSFDLFGNGSAVASGWISGSDGFLAVDKNGNGTIDGISELFGGTAKGAGFAQLAAYDSNNDGLVNTSDVGFADLSIWRDVNGNHQTDAGELLSLALAGVSELVTGYTELPFLDHQGNIHLERSSATLSDGQAVSMTDVYFNVSADDAAAAGVVLPGIADLLNELASRQVPVTDAGWLFA